MFHSQKGTKTGDESFIVECLYVRGTSQSTFFEFVFKVIAAHDFHTIYVFRKKVFSRKHL